MLTVAWLVMVQSAAVAQAAGWQAELDALANEIAKSLGRPAWSRIADDRETARFVEDLKLAAVWPHPALRAPLLKLLEAEEPGIVTLAATGLLTFGEPELRLRVEALRDDPRKHWYTNDIVGTLGYSVTGVLRQAEDEPDRLTIPMAVAALGDADEAVRRRACGWLAERGIILDTTPLEAAWPEASEGARRRLLAVGRVRLGRERLRTTLEAWYARHRRQPHGDYVLGALVRALGRAQSPLLHDIVPPIIADYEHNRSARSARGGADAGVAAQARRELVVAACVALRELGAPGDVAPVLEWSRASRDVVRLGALALLAQSDDARACDAVERFIASGESASLEDFEIDPYRVLRARAWGDAAVKWRYLHALEGELHAATAAATAESLPWRHVEDLTRTLEAVAQVRQGSLPERRVTEAYVASARAIAERWRRWVVENAR